MYDFSKLLIEVRQTETAPDVEIDTVPEQEDAEQEMQTESNGLSSATIFAYLGHLFVLLTVVLAVMWLRPSLSKPDRERLED